MPLCLSRTRRASGLRAACTILLSRSLRSSCDPRLTGRVERAFRAHGFTVARNAPYAGGFTTRRYGRPKRGIHALQIEINRALYMDEQSISQIDGFDRVRTAVSAIIGEILSVGRQISGR